MNTIKVLVAEDHTIVRKGLCALLEAEADIDVVGEAENGRQAVDAYEHGKFDLIFMDLQIPEMGGEEAAKKIRIIEKNPTAGPRSLH